MWRTAKGSVVKILHSDSAQTDGDETSANVTLEAQAPPFLFNVCLTDVFNNDKM